MIKWNRKICIEMAIQMRSALEEVNKSATASPVDQLRVAGEKLRLALTPPREEIIEAQ